MAALKNEPDNHQDPVLSAATDNEKSSASSSSKITSFLSAEAFLLTVAITSAIAGFLYVDDTEIISGVRL